jgi:diguanylate cyclase (GGDEF)-like protein
MTSLADAGRKLRGRYVEGLPSKWRVVKEALAQLRGGNVDADESLRRIAHQVRGSAASFGFVAIDKAAFKVEHATGTDELVRTAEAFIAALRTAYDGESKPVTQVLLIDDDPGIGFVMRSLLVEEVLSITQVTSAAAAMSELEGVGWSLIFVDLVLPDADGRSLLTKIRGLPPYRDTPLVVLSAKTSSLVKNECSMYGIDAFIEKPIDPATFAVQVAALLERARGQGTATANDALTGLANRVGFRRAFEQLVATDAAPRKLTLAVIEVDGFEAFNEAHKRASGDQALTMVANALREQVDDSNLVARWGGEEFIVGFSGLDPVTVIARLEKVSKVLAERSVAKFGEPVKFSAGVSELGPSETLDYGLLRAEQLLYQVKRRRTLWYAHSFESSADGRPKLLVAEDDPMVAALLLRDLSDEFEIIYVADGDAAVEAAGNHTIDLFLLDYQMPGRDGVEVIRTLRQRPEYRTTPMLLLTAVGSDNAVVAAFEAGADDYINKPHRRRSLLARISRHLGRAPTVAPPRPEPNQPNQPAVETEVTALFCDICGFTGITANLPPLAVLELLNTYFPLIAEVVHRHGGTLEKYIGDAVLAIWGAPQSSPDDVVRAVEAAVGIQAVVRELGLLGTPREPPLQVHIGLHSGPVVAASIGGDELSQFAIVGDTTSLASRVCELAGPGEIVMSSDTAKALSGRSRWPVGQQREVELRSRVEPLTICNLQWSA